MFKRLAIILFLLFPLSAGADMTGGAYQIYADSVNTGGNVSSGGIYSLQDTTGETAPAGFLTATGYEMRGGYQAMERGSLSMSLDTTAANLGTLSAATVSTANVVATVTTDAATGYTLSVGSASGATITAVSDGEVTAGAEEYGVAVAGTDASFADDEAVAASLVLASAAVPATNSQTTITFKASVSSSSSGASYSQSVAISASANF